LNDYEANMVAQKFFAKLGRQIVRMQTKIERKLNKVDKLRQVVFDRIQQIAKQTYPEVPEGRLDFEVYGSMATKLAIDTSDMDIAIYGVIPAAKINSSLNPRELTVYAMDQLNERFDAIDWIANNRVIGTASVPVIKLDIDLSKLAKTVDIKKLSTNEVEPSSKQSRKKDKKAKANANKQEAAQA